MIVKVTKENTIQFVEEKRVSGEDFPIITHPLRLHDQPVLALKLLAALSQGTIHFHWE